MSPQAAAYVAEDSFERDTDYISDRITRDERDGWPVEPGRYRLVAAKACPWATRSLIVRSLLGLEDVISLGLAAPVHDDRSWTFDLDPGGRDPVLGVHLLRDAYERRFAGYDKGITVPAMVDIRTGAVVTNDFPMITHDLFFEWSDHHRDGAPDLWPDAVRDEMQEVMDRIYEDVNDGVYQCGFAGSQDSYERAYDVLFRALDWLEERLATRRYLMGDSITEADVRLFTTLARFDAVYHSHFKCNRNKLTEMPALWAYARDLFQTAGFGDNTDFAQIKAHYYCVQDDINPTEHRPEGTRRVGVAHAARTRARSAAG